MKNNSESVNSMQTERELLTQAQNTPWWKRFRIYSKFLGPGFVQSAMTLGGGTASACLLAGSKYGYKLLWIQPLAMFLGVIVLAVVGKQALISGERSYRSVWERIHPSVAILWAVSAMLACVIWHIPQYSLGASSLKEMFQTFGLGEINPWIFGVLILGLSIYLVWNYDKGRKGIRIYENAMKTLVWGIVGIFAVVAFTTGIQWDKLLQGFTGFYIPYDDPKGITIVIGALGAAVGINMVFLYPYSLQKKKWGKEHQGAAIFDLISSMAIPFIFASTFMIIATANTLGAQGLEARSLMDITKIISGIFGLQFSTLILGLGLFAIAFTTITTHMLAAGFIGCEMFNLPMNGKWYRIFSLVPAIGIVGSGYALPFWAAVVASSVAVILMPAALFGFLILNNSQKFLGKDMPRGSRRWAWNIGLSLAIIIISIAGVVSFLNRF